MNGLIGLALLIGFILLIMFAMRYIDFAGHFAPREPKAKALADAAPPPADPFAREVQAIVDTYDQTPATAKDLTPQEARFQDVASEQLEPRLQRIVDEARAAGHQAHLERKIENGAVRYRLEIRRADHLPNEPLPYILLHAGESKDVHVLVGGTFPGRKAENRHRTEVDWYDCAWKDVDEALVDFTRKVFRRFGD